MHRGFRPSGLRPYASSRQSDAGTVFIALLTLRLVNAMTLKTFFQPDEYYQALEPAWQIAFGRESGAWITWEWHYRLRSPLHPAIFACAYAFINAICDVFHCSVSFKSEALVAGPHITQAIFAAITDWCTWLLACSIYSPLFMEAGWATLALTILSPWQWFCSTRTFSNSLETTLTVSALSLWPWHLLDTQKMRYRLQERTSKTFDNVTSPPKGIWTMRLSLGLAALACIMRPTNVIIWLCVAVPTLLSANSHTRFLLAFQSIICGSTALMMSSIVDRLYYGTWTLPLLRFLDFNINRSLAVFYGANRRDYYLTEGLPLLLTTAVPFAVIGTWNALLKMDLWKKQVQKAQERHEMDRMVKSEDPSVYEKRRHQDTALSALCVLAWTCVVFPAILSCIKHKEVRFIYPLLPMLHVLAGWPLASFACSSGFIFSLHSIPAQPLKKIKSVTLLVLVTINICISYYVSIVHQRGVIEVIHQLRKIHENQLVATAERTAFDFDPSKTAATIPTAKEGIVTSFAILMPCHSTPWRSHLVHPNLQGWALTCEPPVDVPIDKRPQYLDEADQFYADPVAWLRQHMRRDQITSADDQANSNFKINADIAEEVEGRQWPSLIIMFSQLESVLGQYLQEKGYERCWSIFNTHWHDDWRRRGDVAIWCLADTGS